MNDSPELAAYQARLLDVLYGDDEVTEADVREAAGMYTDSLGPLDPALVRVASALTKTWGRVR